MKKHFLLWDNPLQAIYTMMCVLILIGGINVLSASFVSAHDMFNDGLYYLKRYFFIAILGFIGIAFIRKIGYKVLLNQKNLFFYCAVVFCMLVAVDVTGVATKGATRWLYFGPISIQPSEIAKLVLIMLAARYLGYAMNRNLPVRLHYGAGMRVTICTLVAAGLVLKQPDLGTAAIIVALIMGMFIIAGLPAKQIAGIIILGVISAVVLSCTYAYRLERVKVWFDPWRDPQGMGYQMVQSLLAIGSGGLYGTNWGHGIGKFFYLPEAHTDFAFAIFCQENGLIGALFIVLSFVIMSAAFCRITMMARDQRGFLLAAGITFLIIGQAFANMAMVCGILPVIGVPLIFISYGGTSMLISMCAIGLLLSVYDEEEKRRQEEEVSPEQRREDLRVVNGRRQQ